MGGDQDVTVYFIGAGPGAPDLITLRGQRLIERCPVCLYAGSLVPSEHPQRLIPVASPAVYADSGHLFYLQGDTLVAVGLDVDRARVHGVPIPVAQNVLLPRVSAASSPALRARKPASG